MSLYVHTGIAHNCAGVVCKCSPKVTEDTYRPATPTEALRYALTCQTCGGSGFTQPTKCKHGQRNMHGGGEWMCAGPVGERKPCPNCIDGIPREWVEAVAENLLPVQVWINQNGEPYHQSWVGASAGQRDWARDIALELLLALRDKEDQWPV